MIHYKEHNILNITYSSILVMMFFLLIAGFSARTAKADLPVSSQPKIEFLEGINKIGIAVSHNGISFAKYVDLYSMLDNDRYNSEVLNKLSDKLSSTLKIEEIKSQNNNENRIDVRFYHSTQDSQIDGKTIYIGVIETSISRPVPINKEMSCALGSRNELPVSFPPIIFLVEDMADYSVIFSNSLNEAVSKVGKYIAEKGE